MKRVLSWLVLIVFYVLFCLVLGFEIRYLLDFVSRFMAFTTVRKILIIIFDSVAFPAALIMPLALVYFGTVAASESISPSVKGTRYKVFGIYVIVSCVLDFVFCVFDVPSYVPEIIRDIVICIYGVALVLRSITIRKEYEEKRLAEEERRIREIAANQYREEQLREEFRRQMEIAQQRQNRQ